MKKKSKNITAATENIISVAIVKCIIKLIEFFFHIFFSLSFPLSMNDLFSFVVMNLINNNVNKSIYMHLIQSRLIDKLATCEISIILLFCGNSIANGKKPFEI